MKKVLSLVLTVVLVLGLSAVAFAAPNPSGKISEVANADLSIDKVTLGLSGNAPTATVEPDTKVYFNILYNGDYLTRSQVRALKLDVQIRATEGSAAIDSAKIDYAKLVTVGTANQKATEVARVELKFAKEFVSTKDLDFSIDLYLTEKKSRLNGPDQVASLSGVFGNDITYVGDGDDYVYLGDSPVVEAEDYIREIQVDLGQSVSIYTKMFEDKKYYGSVSQEINTEDEAVLAKYPDIETVYYLKTINLSSTGDIVAFDLDSNMYVYVQDENGNVAFLGRSNDRLPYYTKYFLSSKELDVEAVDVEEPSEEPSITEPSEEPPVIGGDDAPANVNDNPSTGC